ncbi:hypothetical protein RA29_07700 [Tateyamaria sp. ANG-S1]|nr:hypothetical protein RA29_07700 [Tateyamaria sp. ANG-S1]
MRFQLSLSSLLGLLCPNLVVEQGTVFLRVSYSFANIFSRTLRIEMIEPMLWLVAQWGRQDAVTEVSPYSPTFGTYRFHARNAKATRCKVIIESKQLSF